MNPDDLSTVSRTVTLDASADEIWRLLTDDVELSLWFSATASIDAVPGGVGRFVDGDTVRRAVVHRVEAGRHLGFTWWDENQPDEASTVELVVDDTSTEGQVRLTITETLVRPTGAVDMHACSWIDVADSWNNRLGALEALVDHFAVRCSPLAR